MNIQIFGTNKCFDTKKRCAILRNGILSINLLI